MVLSSDPGHYRHLAIFSGDGNHAGSGSSSQQGNHQAGRGAKERRFGRLPKSDEYADEVLVSGHDRVVFLHSSGRPLPILEYIFAL